MATQDYDVVVIGAGIGGLYATHRLRNEFGLSVHGYERARDVGGVWLWNCYPGARVDMEAKDYAYRFSPELRQEWQWSELFPAQPEILSYLGHVADRFDLRRDFTFNTSVTSLTWDAGSAIWIVNTSDGNTTRARFIIAAPGSMSAPKQPEFPVGEVLVLLEVDSLFCGNLPYTRCSGPTKVRSGRRLPDPKLRWWRLPSARPLPSAATKS